MQLDITRQHSNRPSAHPDRCGFSLVEILVVILIISILMALLLTAVNGARGSAESLQSRNRLRNIALAMQQFRTANGYYPPSFESREYNPNNYLDDSRQAFPGYANLEGYSIHVLLLPFLEENLIAEEVDFSKPYNYYVQLAADNPSGEDRPLFQLADGSEIPLSALRVSTYVSPGEPRDEIRQGKHHPINYAVNLGRWFVWDPITGEGGDGAAYPNSRLKDRNFSDGLSTTMSFAEVKAWNPYFRDSYRSHGDLGDVPPDTPAQLAGMMGTPNQYKETAHTEWFNGHAHHSGFTTVFGPNTKVMIADGDGSGGATVNTSATGTLDADWTNKQEGKNHFGGTPDYSPTYAAITARSYFEGSVNVSMMDGSVHQISEGIHLGVWRALSTRAGKEKLPNNPFD